ncbi:hypothetical protein KR009_009095, partial [Drosophila setifemur]
TQYKICLKLKGKYLGPYDVEKLDDSESPCKTSTVSDFIKPWAGAFGANIQSGVANVGNQHN